METISLDPAVLCQIRRFLELLDAGAPGFVEGLYLTGSIALGDYRSGQSDIDIVAVSAAPASREQLGAIERVQTELKRQAKKPSLDGPFVTWAELAASPDFAAPGPYLRDNRFTAASPSDRHLVAWHSLARHGIAIRGPQPAAVEIALDPSGLAAWTRGNLQSYWRRWRQSAARWTTPLGLVSLGSWAPAWGVLGVSRLHYTLATGEITSKIGAGEYALAAFPQRWRRIVDECLRIRRGEWGGAYPTPLARRREMLDCMEWVIADALDG
jgi:hypothetical protein